MTAHRIVPAALAELDEASTWYEEHEAGLGLDLLGEYQERLALALKMPQTGALAGTTRAVVRSAGFASSAFAATRS